MKLILDHEKIILTLVLVSASLFPFSSAKADIWGANWSAQLLGISLEKMNKILEDTALAVAKKEAIKQIDNSVSDYVSGEAQEKFITDWNNYLYEQTDQRARKYMNDFFSDNFLSRSSMYQNNDASVGSYTKQLEKAARASTTDQSEVVYNLGDYLVGDSDGGINDSSGALDNLFDNGWRGYNALIANPMNNVFGATLIAQQLYYGKLSEEQAAAQASAIANQGFVGQTKDGRVITPGIMIKDFQSKSKTASLDMIVNAKSIPEVATSLATQIMVNTLSEGVGNAANSAQKWAAKKAKELGNDAIDAVSPWERRY